MKRFLTATTAMLVPAACLLYAAVHTDYDHKADFGKYHSYSWIGIRAGNSLWQDRIKQAVDSALSSRGFSQAPSGGDMSVSAFGRTAERDTLQTFYDGFPGWGWRAGWWGGGIGTATTEVIPERVGNLTVDAFDGQTKQLVFRGEASEVLSGDPQKNEKKMDNAVMDMFKKWPAKGEKSN